MTMNLEQRAERGNEVRTPRVEEINGKAVDTWIDPYITDIKEVQVKDLQTNEQQTVAKGVQSAEFAITDNSLLSYRYEMKVVRTTGKVSAGVTARHVEELGAKAAPLWIIIVMRLLKVVCSLRISRWRK